MIGAVMMGPHQAIDVELVEGQARVFNQCWWDVWSDMTNRCSVSHLSTCQISDDEIGVVVKLPSLPDDNVMFLFDSGHIMDVPSRVWRHCSRAL